MLSLLAPLRVNSALNVMVSYVMLTLRQAPVQGLRAPQGLERQDHSGKSYPGFLGVTLSTVEV